MLSKSITDFFKDMVIPPVCVICGSISEDNLCRGCISRIKPISSMESCSRCGRPVPAGSEEGCSVCRHEDHRFNIHRSYALYAGTMKKVIREYKYNRIYSLKDVLAGFLSDIYDRYFYGKKIDHVDTVPGEHTNLLTGAFSRLKRIPFSANIARVRQPVRQGELGLEERKLNVLDCYKLRDCLAWRHKNILLIDDVWTTGSTLNEICRTARRAGAGDIYLATLARGA